MSMNRMKAKGRREGGNFARLPYTLMDHLNYINLSPQGRMLLLDLMRQLRYGKGGVINNGDLCATFSMMKGRGWKSKDTLHTATLELLHYGFIVISRQGERLRNDKPTLYALTFIGVNECGGKLGIPSSQAPLGCWRQEREKYKKASTQKRYNRAAKKTAGATDEKNAGTESGASRYGIRGDKSKYEQKNAPTGTESGATQANSATSPVRNPGNFLESAIGSLSSPSSKPNTNKEKRIGNTRAVTNVSTAIDIDKEPSNNPEATPIKMKL